VDREFSGVCRTDRSRQRRRKGAGREGARCSYLVARRGKKRIKRLGGGILGKTWTLKALGSSISARSPVRCGGEGTGRAYNSRLSFLLVRVSRATDLVGTGPDLPSGLPEESGGLLRGGGHWVGGISNRAMRNKKFRVRQKREETGLGANTGQKERRQDDFRGNDRHSKRGSKRLPRNWGALLLNPVLRRGGRGRTRGG